VIAEVFPLTIRQCREWSGLTASPPFAIGKLNERELLRALYGQQSQSESVHQLKNRGVCADTESQRQYSKQSKTGL
jgi:hypothetical protein